MENLYARHVGRSAKLIPCITPQDMATASSLVSLYRILGKLREPIPASTFQVLYLSFFLLLNVKLSL